MTDKKLSDALADRKYMGIMFRLGGMVEIEDDPTILLDAIRHLESELAFQTKNAADAHQERAHQFRRAADALELLAQAVAENAHSTTCKVIANGRHPSACDCCMQEARQMVALGGTASPPAD